MIKTVKKLPRLAVTVIVASVSMAGFSQSLFALPYSAGTYSSCQYSTCGISISSSDTVNLVVTPTSSSVYTVASDSVTVATSSSTGYQLSLSDTDTNTNLVNGANTIPTSSGSLASPTALILNTWGYRVDGAGGFGAGPTTAQTNAPSSSYTFAGVPASNLSPNIVKTTNSAANPPEVTKVWYGVRLDASKPSGVYTDQVTYTAVTN